MAVGKPEVWWPLDSVSITGDWGNSPKYYAQFGQLGHNGIDLAAPIGTPVYAMDDGIVLMEGWNIPWSGSAGGVAIIIKHWWGYSGYAHLNDTVVDSGQPISRGQLLGHSGMTGVGTGPHLHVETFPPNVNFANGFSGRVNPHALVTILPRGGGSSPSQSSERTTGMKSILHRDQAGSVYFAGPFGYYHLPDIAAGADVSEWMYAGQAFADVYYDGVNARQRDLINSFSRDYWNAARAQIVADLKATQVQISPESITQAVSEAITKHGIKVDVDALASDIAKAVNDETHKRLKE